MMTLFHGFACQPEMWRGVAAGDAPVLLGHGPEPEMLASDRFMDAIDHMAAALAGPHLVGYSMGARVALAIALAHPQRVASLVLIGVNAGIDDAGERAERKRWDEEQAAMLERDGVARFMDRWEALPMFETQQRLGAAQRARIREDRLSHTAAGLAWSMRVLGLGNMPPLLPLLARTELPVLLLCGALDEKGCAENARIAAACPHARQQVVEGAGHNVVAEAPAAVTDAIARYA